jgi:hypothetical protein
VAINDWEFSNKVFASVLIKNKIFLSGRSCKQIHLDLLFIFVCENDFIIVSNAGIGLGLFMLISLLVVIVFVVDGVI